MSDHEIRVEAVLPAGTSPFVIIPVGSVADARITLEGELRGVMIDQIEVGGRVYARNIHPEQLTQARSKTVVDTDRLQEVVETAAEGIRTGSPAMVMIAGLSLETVSVKRVEVPIKGIVPIFTPLKPLILQLTLSSKRALRFVVNGYLYRLVPLLFMLSCSWAAPGSLAHPSLAAWEAHKASRLVRCQARAPSTLAAAHRCMGGYAAYRDTRACVDAAAWLTRVREAM